MIMSSCYESRLIELLLEVNAKLEKFHDAALTCADLSTQIFSGVAKDECLESYRDIKDERLRYHRGSFLRTDRLQHEDVRSAYRKRNLDIQM